MASPFRAVIEAMFKIVNKDGLVVPFTLNSVQQKLDTNWSRRNIVPKARQGGVSSYAIARFMAKCLTMENRTCVLISHERDATTRLLNRAHFIANNLDPKPDLGRRNAGELFFKKNNSSFYIGTAGARTFGHGETITDLLLSEAAYYPDVDSTVKGTFPAAERGEITVESTGNGVGNWYHRMCVRARQGRGFTLHFFPWIDVPEYTLPFASVDDQNAFAASLLDDLEEPTLLARGCTLAQLRWRRERLEIDFDGDLRKFKEAYPIDFDECFQSSGFSFFRRVRFEPTDRWVRDSAHLWKLTPHPSPGLTYVIGGDPSGGVGRDNAVAQVFCLESCEQVAEYASPWTEPHEFGAVLAGLGRTFNNAYINVERNNHGSATLARLIDVYPLELVHRGDRGEPSNQMVLSRLSHYGTNVGPSNRGIIIGTARELLATEFTIHSALLKAELDTFIEKEGRIEADEGCFDDRVMAVCHALICVERAGIATTSHAATVRDQEPDPFSFESLFSRHIEDAAGSPREFIPEIYH